MLEICLLLAILWLEVPIILNYSIAPRWAPSCNGGSNKKIALLYESFIVYCCYKISPLEKMYLLSYLIPDIDNDIISYETLCTRDCFNDQMHNNLVL